MKIICTRESSMLFLLFLYVILGLLHADKHLLKFLVLLVLVRTHLPTLDVLSHIIIWFGKLFDLEVDNCATDLDCFSLGVAQR
jgi:hypothetical protein